MKKKLLTAAILSALTLSATSVFASPINFSGDANIEYSAKDNENSELTNRIRLVIDSQIDQNLYLHGRMVMNNNIATPNATGVWGDKATVMEQGYIGYKNGNMDITAGRQPLFLGHGLLSDVNGIGGLKIKTTLDNANLMGFYGKDGAENVSAANFGTALGNVDFGLSYLKKTDNFYGVNASTKIANGVVFNAEYIKNNDQPTQNKGYWTEVKFGNASKKGEFDYSLGYVNVENNAVPAGYITEGNMQGGKGFRAKAHYAVTDNATLTVYQDMFKTTDGTNTDKKRTDVEFEVRF